MFKNDLFFSTYPHFSFRISVPATIVSTVECSYPVPEDASVGFLYIGANVMAIPLTFLGQVIILLYVIMWYQLCL